MEEARLTKQRLELQREMEKNMKKADKPKAKKVKKIGGLTLEEMHEKMRKEKLEKKRAKARHLKRAFASIDRTQYTDENVIFKTISRDKAIESTVQLPQGTEVGKYNPIIKEKTKMPCFVRIQDDKADRIDKTRPKEPAMKYAQTARCVDFVPHPQHDELPKVNCLKLGKKLENFRELIKTSSCKKKVLKSGSQIDSSVVKLEPTGLNTEDSLFEPSKKS